MAHEEKKNRSLTYLLPLALKEFNVNKTAIVNTYLFYENGIDLNLQNGIFVKLLYSGESKDTFKFNTRCKYIEDLDEKHFLVFIEFPIRFKKDVELLLESKYSQISQEAKYTIINFMNASMDSVLVKVLNKDPEYKKFIEEHLDCVLPDSAELGNKFNLSKEFLIINNVKPKTSEV